jgi:hypothetical protein
MLIGIKGRKRTRCQIAVKHSATAKLSRETLAALRVQVPAQEAKLTPPARGYLLNPLVSNFRTKIIRASPTSFRVAWIQRAYENGSLSATERLQAALSGNRNLRIANCSRQAHQANYCAYHRPDIMPPSLNKHRSDHHSFANQNYGVTTTLWDHVFRTMLQ